MRGLHDPLLVCDGVSKQFGGVSALKSLTLTVFANEFLGVIGPNGSGKTTLFNVITGIFPASAGSIHFDGRSISGWTAQQRHRAGISRTFQRSRLCLNASIFDNLAVGNHTRLSNGMVFNLLNRSQLKREVEEQFEQCRKLLHIFDPKLAGRMTDLVGNQPMIDRRRIEVCRALVSSPKLLLLDEPSAGMTEYETHQLMENILAMKGQTDNLAIILIEHEMGVIKRISDRCAVLNFGTKICEGSYEEVTNNVEVQEAYLGSQLELS